MRTHLLIIDPQNDFCDPEGSLYVPGADKDMERLADLIKSHKVEIDQIHVTLDMHQKIDIAHPVFWCDVNQRRHPDHFTIIDYDNVKNGKWITTNGDFYNWARNYVETLKDKGRYSLCIWPPHCLIGTWGCEIDPVLNLRLSEWSHALDKPIDYVIKGMDPFTEHYSGIKAEVPSGDPSSAKNELLLETLSYADRILITGEASSHCVLNTVKDIADELGDEAINKFVFLTDTMSPVIHPEIDFPKIAQDFIDEMVSRGATAITSDELKC